jgi:hypothetical protein
LSDWKRKVTAEYVPTDAQRSLVESASAFGITQAEIATQLKISEPTLRKHFREELDGGAFKANMRVGGNLFEKLCHEPSLFGSRLIFGGHFPLLIALLRDARALPTQKHSWTKHTTTSTLLRGTSQWPRWRVATGRCRRWSPHA